MKEAEAWDAEYRAGRYDREPPVAFVDDILAAARSHDLIGKPGLYVGCGNGRNYLPLVAGGLDLTGMDISRAAIGQLRKKAPARGSKLIVGDISALPPDEVFPMVVGLQVFQHGTRARAHAHLRMAQDRVAPGGLICVRVNAVGTDIEYEHDVIEPDTGGGFTITYTAGPKTGLDVHFFGGDELSRLFEGWHPVLPLRAQLTARSPVERGQWTQWEAIWQRTE